MAYVNRSFLALCALTSALLPVPGVCAAPPPAPSPSPSPSASPGLREIGRVFTSDRRSEPAADSSKPTFVVDRARIDEYGSRTIADALQDVPGVDLFPRGSFGSQTDYSIRGGPSDQTLVLVDGIPVSDPTTGAVQLSEFSTIGVDRIEIVESGSSTLYGTNATGGVINIITKVPRGVYLDAFDGSNNDRDLRVGAGNGVVGFTLERRVSTGDYNYPGIDYGPLSTCNFGMTPCAFPAGVRGPAYGDQSAGRFSLDLPAAFGFTVRARADETATHVGDPGSITFLSSTASEADFTNSALLELEHASRHSTLTIDLAGSQTHLSYDDPVGNYGESDTYTGRSQASIRDAFASGRIDGVVGIDLSRESGTFSFPTSPNFAATTPPTIPAYAIGAAESQTAAYVQLGAAPFRGTRLTAGVRGENDAPHGSVLAPSFGGTIKTGALTFAGDVGESFRVPTLQDLYYPGFSNPNLLPEKAQTADTTVTYDARGGSLSAGWFDRNGSNFIISEAPSYLPFNAQHASVAGIQVTAATKPRFGFIGQVGFTDSYRAFDYDTGGRLPRYPAGTVNFSLDHPFARTNVNYGLRWDIVGSDGDDRSQVAGPLAATYDAYDSLDAYVRFKLASNAVLSLRGFNLGNEYAAPVFGYPSPGRRYAVEFSTK